MENLSGSSTFNAPYDRRRKTRFPGPIPAHVCGADNCGLNFNLKAQLDNLSAGGLYVRLARKVSRGTQLWASFRLPAGPGMEQVGTQWTARGVIRRVETRPNGTSRPGVQVGS